jgi:uncharacterized RDD family membrane protein YckC
MARPFASWLSGPPPPEAGDPTKGPADYPGQRLGLPQNGPRSLARLGRRVGALLIDWLIGYGLAALGLTLGIVSMPTLSTAVLVVWFVLGVISLRLFGFTPGQLALGLTVVPVDGREHVGIGRAAVRGLLIALVIPALVTDSDLRGLQDRATNTAVVRR